MPSEHGPQRPFGIPPVQTFFPPALYMPQSFWGNQCSPPSHRLTLPILRRIKMEMFCHPSNVLQNAYGRSWSPHQVKRRSF